MKISFQSIQLKSIFSKHYLKFILTMVVYLILSTKFITAQAVQNIKSLTEELKKIENSSGTKNTNYRKGLIMLSRLYIDKGNFTKAVDLLNKTLSSFEVSEKNKSLYFNALNELASVYYYIGDYKQSLETYDLILPQLKNPNHILSVKNSMGIVHQKLGNYENALKYFIEVSAINNKNHKDYSKFLENLAFTHANLGDYQSAEDIYQSALITMKSTVGENHFEYGKLQNNIGKLYYNMGNFNKAETYFKASIENLLISHDINHPSYGYYLADLVKTHLHNGDYNTALELSKKNLAILEKSGKTENEDYIHRVYNLAVVYLYLDQFEKALPLLKQCAQSIKVFYGDEHPTYGRMLKSLSEAYIGLDDTENALPYLLKSNEIIIDQLSSVFKFRSEQEQKAFLEIASNSFHDLQSLSIGLKNDLLNEQNLNNTLMLKGLLLNNSKDVLSNLSKLNDSIIENNITEYRSLKKILYNQLIKHVSLRTHDVDSLKTLINAKETALVKLYNSKFENNLNFTKDWKESRDKLLKDEIAIEFVHFPLRKDSITYVAYLYKRDWKTPKIVSLFQENELITILSHKSPGQIYSTRGSKAISINNDKVLYDLIWSPLESYLADISTIYFSPSGLLNQIAFSALKDDSNMAVIERYELNQLSSTANIAEDFKEPKFKQSLLIGGIDYDEQNTSGEATELYVKSYLTYNTLNRSGSNLKRGEGWTDLPGTLKEIEIISDLLSKNNHDNLLLQGANATKTAFKKLDGNSPSLLHIATHGFFFENSDKTSKNSETFDFQDIYKYSEDPLLRAGLLFAGANRTWKAQKTKGVDDGILTALEIANMDLSQTDIVVLSACETGLGDIEGNEGVYGLQRAFKMAGVENIIMSLWEVPDEETVEFMTYFYKEWINSKDVRSAFRDTQLTMQKKYTKEPTKWAAFVLVN